MNINVVVKKYKYLSFWSIYQACVKKISSLKSREEKLKNLLDSEVSDKSEEVGHQHPHVEQLNEIELLKTGNCLKLHDCTRDSYMFNVVVSKLARSESNDGTVKASIIVVLHVPYIWNERLTVFHIHVQQLQTYGEKQMNMEN